MSNEKLTILLSPTHRCNMRCEYCYVSHDSHFDMTKEDFFILYQWLFEYAKFVNVSYLDFTWFGGEPLLYGIMKLQEALELQSELLISRGIKCINRMQSNLTLVNAECCTLLRKYFSGFIGGSFEPFGTSRNYCDGRNAAVDIERNILFLRNNGIKVGIVSTLMNRDLPPPSNLYNWFAAHVDSFRVNRAHPPIKRKLDGYMTIEEYNQYILKLFDIYINDIQRNVKFTNFDVISNAIQKKEPLVCIDSVKPWMKLSVSGKGEISSYCRLHDKYLGNYYKDSPEEIIAAYLKKNLESTLNPCNQCEFFHKRFCGGNCYGETDKTCDNSICGYRTECTKEIISYISNFLKQKAKGCK